MPPRQHWSIYLEGATGHDDDNNYLVTGVNEVFRVLNVYGHIFTNLHYRVDDLADPLCQQIFEYCDKYCSRAIKMITLAGVDTFTNSTYSFDQTMKKVIVSSPKNDRVISNTMFPFIEELSIIAMILPIGQHFPCLTKCSFLSFQAVQSPNELEMIRLNPQLRQYETILYNNNVSFVRYLNERLPNLETLAFSSKRMLQTTKIFTSRTLKSLH